MSRITEIQKLVKLDDLLTGLAEEASELAKAALKYRRALYGTNPTPISEDDAYENLCEEIADVFLYVEALRINTAHISRIEDEKAARWISRLTGGAVR